MPLVLCSVDDYHPDLLVYYAVQLAREKHTTPKQITDIITFYTKTSWRHLVSLVFSNIWDITTALLVLLVDATMIFKVMNSKHLLINVRMSTMTRIRYSQDINCKHTIKLRVRD